MTISRLRWYWCLLSPARWFSGGCAPTVAELAMIAMGVAGLAAGVVAAALLLERDKDGRRALF